MLSLKRFVLIWVAYCLFGAPDIFAQPQYHQMFLHFCSNFLVFLHRLKYFLWTPNVKWCNHIISAKGIRHHPTNIQWLSHPKCPTNAGQLDQFLWTAQWINYSFPPLQRVIQLLHGFFQIVNDHVCGKRTKETLSRVKLDTHGWTAFYHFGIQTWKNVIIQHTILAHRDISTLLYVYTDTIETQSSGILA